MRHSICFVVLALSATGAAVSAPAPAAADARSAAARAVMNEIADAGFNHSEIPETAEYLDDQIGGRMTNSPAMRRAERWTADQFTRLGPAERPHRRLRLRPRLVDRGGAHPHDCAASASTSRASRWPGPRPPTGALSAADRRGADGQRQGLRAVEGQAVGQDRARQLPGARDGRHRAACSSASRTPTSPSATISCSRSRIPGCARSASSATASASSSMRSWPRKARVALVTDVAQRRAPGARRRLQLPGGAHAEAAGRRAGGGGLSQARAPGQGRRGAAGDREPRALRGRGPQRLQRARRDPRRRPPPAT